MNHNEALDALAGVLPKRLYQEVRDALALKDLPNWGTYSPKLIGRWMTEITETKWRIDRYQGEFFAIYANDVLVRDGLQAGDLDIFLDGMYLRLPDTTRPEELL